MYTVMRAALLPSPDTGSPEINCQLRQNSPIIISHLQDCCGNHDIRNSYATKDVQYAKPFNNKHMQHDPKQENIRIMSTKKSEASETSETSEGGTQLPHERRGTD